MKKILMSLLTLGVMSAVTVAGTLAYFNSQDTSVDNVFETGTLTIDVDQDATASSKLVVSNWQPGDSDYAYTNITNTGSLAVHLKGYAMGSWTAGSNLPSSPDNTLVGVSKVEYNTDGSSTWYTLAGDGTSPLTGEYYYTSNGGSTGSWYTLAPGDTLYLKLKVDFDSSADNDYQGATYTANIHMAAKQVTAPHPAGWPATY